MRELAKARAPSAGFDQCAWPGLMMCLSAIACWPEFVWAQSPAGICACPQSLCACPQLPRNLCLSAIAFPQLPLSAIAWCANCLRRERRPRVSINVPGPGWWCDQCAWPEFARICVQLLCACPQSLPITLCLFAIAPNHFVPVRNRSAFPCLVSLADFPCGTHARDVRKFTDDTALTRSRSLHLLRHWPPSSGVRVRRARDQSRDARE